MQDWFVSVQIDYVERIPTPTVFDANGLREHDSTTAHGRLLRYFIGYARLASISARGGDGFYTKFVAAQVVSAENSDEARTAAEAMLRQAAVLVDVAITIIEIREPKVVVLTTAS